MVDESRFRYRRDAGTKNDAGVGTQVPSEHPDPRQPTNARPPQETLRQERPRQEAPRQEVPRQEAPRQPQGARPLQEPRPATSNPRDLVHPAEFRPVDSRQTDPRRVEPRPAQPQSSAPAPRPPIPPRQTDVRNPAAAAPRPAATLPRPDLPASARIPTPPARPAAPPAPEGGGYSDALAELARLIGEQDPFADLEAVPSRVPPASVAPVAVPRPQPRSDSRQFDGAQPASATSQPRAVRAAEGAVAPRLPTAARPSPDTAARLPAQAPQRPTSSQDVAAARAAMAKAQQRRGASAEGDSGAPDAAAQAQLPAPDAALRRPAAGSAPRAPLVPPRGDAEPVDRSATSVRLGYGSLAHQAQVAPRSAQPTEARRPQPPLAEPGEREFSRQRPATPAEPAPRPQPQEQPAAYAYSAPRRADADEEFDEYDDAYEPQYGEDGYMPPHGEEIYDGEARRRKSRSALILAGTVLGLVVAGTAGVFAYRMVSSGSVSGAAGGPPVIRADTHPSKIVTPQNANAADPQQKLIYDRMGAGGGNEKMLPREEQPVDVTAVASHTAQPATDPVINALSAEPKRVRTLTVRADGSIAQEGTASANSGSGAEALQAYASSQMPGAPPANLGAVATASAKITVPPVARTGDYVVQVASQRSEADAMGSWKALQTRYPNLLGSYTASVKKADLGDRGVFFRAQVGPFASRDHANELCQALRAQGGDCVVTKN